MKALDIRAGAFSINGTPNTVKTVTFTFSDGDDPWEPAECSLWVGGSLDDPTDFSGATRYEGVLAGSTATVSFTVPQMEKLPLRLTLNSVLATVGTLTTSLRGAESPTDEVAVQMGDVTVDVTLPGPPGVPGGMFFVDDDGFLNAVVPSTSGVGDSLTVDNDGLILLTIGD